jgi:predicted PurR-regulated permease PerM
MGAETTLLDPRKADDEERTTTVPAPVGIRSLSLTVLAIVAGIFALRYGQQFFIPLVISVLVSYALDPIVSWITRRGVPRSIAAAVVLLLTVGSIGTGAYSLRDEAATIVQQLPQAAQRLRAALRKDRHANRGGTIDQVQKAASELSQAASEATPSAPVPKGVVRVQVEEPAVKVSDYLWWSTAGILTFAGQAVSVLFLVYFMLMS